MHAATVMCPDRDLAQGVNSTITPGSIRLTLSASHGIVFFSHNKSASAKNTVSRIQP
jgi:hypothetical protein